MADINVFCPHCGKRAVLDETIAGRHTVCPYCRGEFTVPLGLKSSPAPLRSPGEAGSNPPSNSNSPSPLALRSLGEAGSPSPSSPSRIVLGPVTAPAPAPAAPAPEPAAALAARAPITATYPAISPAPAPSPADPEAALAAEVEERDVSEMNPSALDFLGLITLAAGLVVAGVLLAFVVSPFTLIAGAIGLLLVGWVWLQIKSVRYRLTTQRLFLRRGLIAKHIEEVELYRVKDVVLNQTMVDRILNVGTVSVLSTDDSTPQLDLRGVRNPHALKELIRTHFRAAKRRERVGTAEFISS
jgi:membrane protein YdbS with pleckstrin-like domain